MKSLFIVRHAKSSWDDSSLRDIERPLNNRGKRDAPRMASFLFSEIGSVDRIISSPAVRAQTTANEFADAFGKRGEVEIDQRIYGASSDRMLNILNNLSNSYSKVCLFGHNPTFTYFAEKLADVNIGNLPTCGIVGIEFSVDDWQAVSWGSGQQIMYEYPKSLF